MNHTGTASAQYRNYQISGYKSISQRHYCIHLNESELGHMLHTWVMSSLSWLLSEHGHMLHIPVMSIVVIVWTWSHATYLSDVYHGYCLNMATCYIPQWCLSWLLSEHGHMLHTPVMSIVVIVWTWPHAIYLSDVYRGYCLNMATSYIPQWCLSWLLSEHGHMLHTSVMSIMGIVWTWPHAT